MGRETSGERVLLAGVARATAWAALLEDRGATVAVTGEAWRASEWLELPAGFAWVVVGPALVDQDAGQWLEELADRRAPWALSWAGPVRAVPRGVERLSADASDQVVLASFARAASRRLPASGAPDAELAELEAAFRATLPGRLAQLDRGLDQARARSEAPSSGPGPDAGAPDPLPEARGRAHQLRGTAAAYGLAALAQAAMALERVLEESAAREQDRAAWARIDQCRAQLAAEVEAASGAPAGSPGEGDGR